MIYGKKFNIAHMPKTGGTFLRRVCEKLSPAIIENIYPHHRPCRELTPAQVIKPTYVFVRNPWDWYVSLYSHWNSNIIHKRHEFSVPENKLDPRLLNIKHRFGGSFEKSLEQIGNFQASPHQPEKPKGFKTFSDQLDNFSKFKGDGRAIVLKFEDGVSEGLIRILKESHPEALNAQVLKIINAHPKENVSKRRSYSSYYDESLKKKVEEAEKHVIDTYNYTFK